MEIWESAGMMCCSHSSGMVFLDTRAGKVVSDMKKKEAVGALAALNADSRYFFAGVGRDLMQYDTRSAGPQAVAHAMRRDGVERIGAGQGAPERRAAPLLRLHRVGHSAALQRQLLQHGRLATATCCHERASTGAEHHGVGRALSLQLKEPAPGALTPGILPCGHRPEYNAVRGLSAGEVQSPG